MSDRQEAIMAFVLVPNSVETRFRRSIIDLGEEGFFDVMAEVNKNMHKVLRSARGSYPYVSMSQRRFPSRRSMAITDGVMTFDLRTAFPGGKNQKVKVQRQWLSAVYSLIANKKSNMDFGVGVSFPYESCNKVNKPAILDSIAASWIASKPLLDVMLKK
jgi:hypothetical protein